MFGSHWHLKAATGTLALLLAVATAVAVHPDAASAHERRTVGKYSFVVGWIVEPALANEPNGVDLRITDTTTSQPVDGAAPTLKVELIQGSAVKEVALRARFGVPGGYTADIIPTKSGAYNFHFSGTINGDAIDEKFESGPGRYNDVEDPSKIQFPATSAVTAPSNDQVSQIVRQVNAQELALNEALETARTARTIGYAGALIGLIGLAAAAFSLTRSKQSASAPRQMAADSRA